MPDATRRGFLAMTGGGVAAAGAVALVPTLLAADRETSAMPHRQTDDVKVDGPLIAYVNDVSTGEVVVMVGEREVTAIDHDLAERIARLSRAGA